MSDSLESEVFQMLKEDPAPHSTVLRYLLKVEQELNERISREVTNLHRLVQAIQKHPPADSDQTIKVLIMYLRTNFRKSGLTAEQCDEIIDKSLRDAGISL